MFADIKAVMWKECLEIFWANSDRRKVWLRLLLFMTIVAIVLPIPTGDENQINTAWFQLWCLIPILVVMGTIPDSFAGERERHTLETLLASRLSDRAIVLGKMAVAVIYAWTLSILSSISLLIKTNIIDGGQQLKFYPLDFFFSGLVGSLLLSILVASICVLVSFKAESIKQAYKRVTMVVAALTLLPSIILLIAVFLVSPSMQLTAVSKLLQTGSILVMVGSLAVFDSILVAWVLKSFKRSHLMSD